MRKIQTWSVLLEHGYKPLLSTNISSYLDITLCSKTVPLSYTGGGIYIKNLIPYKRLPDWEDPKFGVLWSHIRPPRLPRGTSCIIVGTIYHPPRSDDSAMLDYLITTLISLEGLYSGCGILLTGDFNHLKIQRLVTQFKMKQLVSIPTRGKNILDLIITNMHQAYDCNSICTIPPFGLSDHNGVLLRPKERSPNINSSRKILEKRDTTPLKALT